MRVFNFAGALLNSENLGKLPPRHRKLGWHKTVSKASFLSSDLPEVKIKLFD